jgi:RNA polymerase sigma-54 factor
MTLSAKLELKQSQNLIMTPQLQQAIKLLQLSNLELTDFVEAELERNPLLEHDDSAARAEPEAAEAAGGEEAEPAEDAASEDEWLNLAGDGAKGDPSGTLDTDSENVFPDVEAQQPQFSDTGSWASLPSKAPAGGNGSMNLEAFVAEEVSLQDHLTQQLHLAVAEPAKRLIGQHLIDMVDEAGYLRGDIDGLAERLGAPMPLIEATLAILQSFDPAGVFARDLGECLALQLQDRNRYDPAIAALIANLDLLAAHDHAALKRVCSADNEDLHEMIAEVKMLNPKPGLRFGKTTVQPVIPDVFVRQRPDGSWHVELNSDTLPKLLVSRSYYATVSKTATTDKDKSYLQECLQTANWLVKSLDQRARTILKVSQEIVRQQDAFLIYGVQHLRPLNLKTVADAIAMHESTVSRVTSNKYMATSRGIFELKYFFSSAIAAAGAGEAHSSEAVRHRIRELIDNEALEKVLSDDKIVGLLLYDGVDIARRTVAKYREAMRIPSSVQRRRDKRMAARATH